MKLCYYIDTDIPSSNASTVHVMKMCQAFQKNGHDVTLYCNSVHKIHDFEDVFQKYGITERFQIKTVQISDFMREHGHRFGAYRSAWLKTREKQEQAYAYSRSALSLYFLRNAMPFIYEAHLEPDIISRQIELAVLKHKNCKGVVVVTQALKKKYLELFPFISEEKITVLHDAADIDSSVSIEKAQLKGWGERPNIGYVGSLFPGKCMETLLPLAKVCPQYNFHVVGGSEDWINHWKEKAQEMQLDNLIFYGFVDNSKLGDYYRAFDISILPFSEKIQIGKSKRVDIGQWTSPLKLFEAMAYKKPIIVSRLATIEEVMDNQKDCIMVQPDNIDDWKKKLEALCEDKELQNKIACAAQEKLCNEYTWTERAKKAAKLFL